MMGIHHHDLCIGGLATMARVVLAMSGGVDSSVAAHLLMSQGHEVIGVFMRHGEQAVEACRGPKPSSARSHLPLLTSRPGHKQGCCTASDAEDGRRVAERLGIPFYALNLQAEFGQIIDYFVEEYSAGRTPNPCIRCNNWIKFGRLFDYADSVDAQYVATGHYARLCDSGSATPSLLAGIDDDKDQSYVLFGIRREYLRRMLLPVGDYRKPDIRGLAAQLGLDVARKKDSQEICFVTQGHHGDFVRAHRSEADLAGELVTTGGEVVGRHTGIESFTIGQRKGLGVALGEPHFVVSIEPGSRRVVLGKRAELARQTLTANQTNWLVDPPSDRFSCQAKIRYNSPAQDALAEVLPEGRLSVEFRQPQFGIAPGQAVVCYEGPRVLGGGWIESG
jgi:tRNA-specific 2-thiouridylase